MEYCKLSLLFAARFQHYKGSAAAVVVYFRSPQIKFFSMDVVTECGDADNSGPVPQIFLYKLVPGHSGRSFGICCAQMCGVRQDVIDRAKAIAADSAAGRRTGMAPALLGKQQCLEACVQRLVETDPDDSDGLVHLLSMCVGGDG